LEFLVVGLNHRTAPLEVRERLAVSKNSLPEALRAMQDRSAPGVILCTCNRSEFYTLEPDNHAGSVDGWANGDERVKKFLVDYFDISLLDVERYIYVYRDVECIQHLFRVVSGLDSMILGEKQVVGQVREAFAAAVRADTVPQPLSHLFQRALRAGRRVRRDTAIGQNALSISRACVELARGALGDLSQRRVMVVGTGDAGRLVAEALRSAGAREIVVTNRTYQRAVELANDLSAQAIPFADLAGELRHADIVIACTGSPGYVLEAPMVRAAMALRPDRPLFLMDIAVPRDIDPAAAQISNVFLHDLDDLETVSQASRLEKAQEVEQAEEMVAKETQRFLEWCLGREVLPTVIALRHQAEEVRQRELRKTVGKLDSKLAPEELASLDAMTRAIVNKLLHNPTVYLKQQRNPGNLHIAREIFQLPTEDR
jgi:glutamyl-tRNA reductase